MCHPATCRSCGKVTWSGCGMHVADVMSRVPRDQQCACESRGRSGLFSRFRGRR